MVKIDLKGVAKATAKGRVYYYAWRGGPRLRGKPGSPEFVTSYQEAHENRRTPDSGRFRSLITLYKTSQDYKGLADSTKRNWAPWLDRIGDYFGDLRIAQFDRPEKITADHPQVAQPLRGDKPRTADYGLQVLSRVLSYAVDPLGKIAANPCEGIKQLYSGDRSEIIWTDADIARLKSHLLAGDCPGGRPRLAYRAAARRPAARLMVARRRRRNRHRAPARASGGARRSSRSMTTLRDVLARIPKRSTTILTNSRHRPWTTDGFGSSFNKAKNRGWHEGR